MQVDAPHGNHRLVSLALMETYVRYHRVLAQNPAILRRVLSFFLGNNGIGHADTVRCLPPPLQEDLEKIDCVADSSLLC